MRIGTLGVHFQHDRSGRQPSTTCVIHEGECSPGCWAVTDLSQGVVGTVKQFLGKKGDQFNKAAARKASFDKAINALYPDKNEESKIKRQAAWEAFRAVDRRVREL